MGLSKLIEILAHIWASMLGICAVLQGRVLAQEESFPQVGEIGDLERREIRT